MSHKSSQSSVRRSNVRLTCIGKGKHCFSSSLELVELVSSPRLTLICMVLEVGNGSGRVVSFLNVALVSLVHIIVEGIFKRNGVVLLSSLDSDGEGSDDGLEGSP